MRPGSLDWDAGGGGGSESASKRAGLCASRLQPSLRPGPADPRRCGSRRSREAPTRSRRSLGVPLAKVGPGTRSKSWGQTGPRPRPCPASPSWTTRAHLGAQGCGRSLSPVGLSRVRPAPSPGGRGGAAPAGSPEWSLLRRLQALPGTAGHVVGTSPLCGFFPQDAGIRGRGRGHEPWPGWALRLAVGVPAALQGRAAPPPPRPAPTALVPQCTRPAAPTVKGRGQL